MRAVVVDRWMPPAELRVQDFPTPSAGPGELAVDVHAAGCNFMDILLVQGRYQRKPPFPFVPGVELAGVVREVGEGVTSHAPGDRVLAHVQSGAYAERAVFSARRAFHMPDGMSFEEGAAIPITYPTSYAALVYRADLQAGETLLVHAAAGGVGLAAVQIGRALGARVIATAGGAEKCEIARRHGAELAIDYRDRDFVDAVMEATDGRGADVIYDSVGGDTTDRSLKCIAWNGRLLVVGFAGGQIPEIRANRIMLKNIAVSGVHWGAYAKNEPDRVQDCFRALFQLHARGQIAPLIYGRYELEDLPAALEALGGRKTHGKVIIAI